MFTHSCPACGTTVGLASPRHSGCLCSLCVDLAADSQGRPVELFNQSLSGGVRVLYSGSEEVCEEAEASGLVYVRSTPYRLVEGHFGGVLLMGTDS